MIFSFFFIFKGQKFCFLSKRVDLTTDFPPPSFGRVCLTAPKRGSNRDGFLQPTDIFLPFFSSSYFYYWTTLKAIPNNNNQKKKKQKNRKRWAAAVVEKEKPAFFYICASVSIAQLFLFDE